MISERTVEVEGVKIIPNPEKMDAIVVVEEDTWRRILERGVAVNEEQRALIML
jgi:hypothetical protein